MESALEWIAAPLFAAVDVLLDLPGAALAVAAGLAVVAAIGALIM